MIPHFRDQVGSISAERPDLTTFGNIKNSSGNPETKFLYYLWINVRTRSELSTKIHEVGACSTANVSMDEERSMWLVPYKLKETEKYYAVLVTIVGQVYNI